RGQGILRCQQQAGCRDKPRQAELRYTPKRLALAPAFFLPFSGIAPAVLEGACWRWARWRTGCFALVFAARESDGKQTCRRQTIPTDSAF
ncbi:hypothetical protein, partial [uncultured Cobetia sp.]|uniref:hypothetical protein n=1 Tax=uncultured Cobetia sp. TaxID=410706 RepID=UPI0025867999